LGFFWSVWKKNRNDGTTTIDKFTQESLQFLLLPRSYPLAPNKNCDLLNLSNLLL
jgi:hypothetical protein